MFHPVKDQELNPEKYKLTSISPSFLEDDCHDLLSKPRQTQTTIGLYLRKADRNGTTEDSPSPKQCLDSQFSMSCRLRFKKEVERQGLIMKMCTMSIKPDPNKRDNYLEKLLEENKGFWVDKPTLTAPLLNKLNQLYNVELPSKKGPKKSQAIFYRPDYLEWDYLIKLGQKGLLYSDEEISDSEDVKPDETLCLPLRKKKYKICDPCKTKAEKKEKYENVERTNIRTSIKKIPTGCQCDYYGEHNKAPNVWDNPFRDEEDMIRQHEMNKYLRPYKAEILRKFTTKTPKASSFEIREHGAKRTFPAFTLSNL